MTFRESTRVQTQGMYRVRQQQLSNTTHYDPFLISRSYFGLLTDANHTMWYAGWRPCRRTSGRER